MLQKPSGCFGCPLESRGKGFAPPVGPKSSPLLFVGEALGEVEATRGIPFVGPAGKVLDHILRRRGLDRQEQRIANLVSCQPPNDWLDGAPWEYEAVNHCRQYLEPVLQEDHKVVVALGGSATRRLLGLGRQGHVQANWHGTVQRDPTDRFWIVPTYHPSFLQRGQFKYFGVVAHDLQVALDVAATGLDRRPSSLVIDPTIEWFDQWVKEYLNALEGGQEVWLAIDIETKGKGTDEGEIKDDKYDITRINFSYSEEEGTTVPWAGAYKDAARRLLSSSGVKVFWNANYDITGLRLAGFDVSEPIIDAMDAWHILQPDLPKGLGFVAPFYSDYGAWKHLSTTDQGRYASIDALQTIRVAFGIAKNLQAQGQWESFYRHSYTLDTRVLHPAERTGLRVHKDRLDTFQADLQKKAEAISGEIQHIVPDVLKPELVWKRKPGSGLYSCSGIKEHTDECASDVDSACQELPHPRAVEEIRHELVKACLTCGKLQVATTHRCEDKSLVKQLGLIEADVPRWACREDFNPGSSPQVLGYILSKKHKPGKKSKKTGIPSTDNKVLTRLLKTKDPLYSRILEHRAVDKIHGTYAEGTRKRLKGDRLHTTFLHVPASLRLSSVNPNIQNVVTDKRTEASLAKGFRKCIIPSDGCVLLEADFAGIEAIETGWLARDPDYIRLATLGVHAYLTSHNLNKPADLKWTDEHLAGYFKELKKGYPTAYDKCKHVVHGTNYGLTPYGMQERYPEEFATIRDAEKLQNLYFEICPKLAAWQKETRDKAHIKGFLGLDDHPFRYRRWFWNVYNAQGKFGLDADKAIAFMPSSIAAGVLYESCLRLLDESGPNYIGDVYFGRSPVLALIHDSILLDVPRAQEERVIKALQAEMTRAIDGLCHVGSSPDSPIVPHDPTWGSQPCPPEWNLGQFLTIGIEIARGDDNWLDMEPIVVGKIQGLAGDTVRDEVEEEVVA